MDEKQSLILAPKEALSCACCANWKRYAPWDGEQSNWGKCGLEDVPQYMYETYFTRGCNKHSSLFVPAPPKVVKKSSDVMSDQISLF